MAILPVLALASFFVASPPERQILLKSPESSSECLLDRRLQRLLQLTPGLRLGHRPEAEFRTLKGADPEAIAIDLKDTQAGLVLTLYQPGKPPQSRLLQHGEPLGPTLLSLWPDPKPRDLPLDADWLSPSEMAKGCTATEADPPAIPTLPGALSPWIARAYLPLAEGSSDAIRCSAVKPRLERFLRDLKADRLPPLWVRGPSALEVEGRTLNGNQLQLFFDGRFEWVDAATGITRAVLQQGRAEPELWPVDARRWVSVESTAVSLIQSGKVRWKTPLKDPRAELARREAILFVTDSEGLVALDLAKGSPIWRHSSLHSPSAGAQLAGPSGSGARLALPVQSKIVWIDPKGGQRLAITELHDEISGTLIVTPSGDLWVPVGSQELMRVEGKPPHAIRQRYRVRGMDWPGQLVGEKLLVHQNPARRAHHRLFSAEANVSQRLPDGPAASYPGGFAIQEGRQISFYDADGERIRRYRSRRRPEGLRASPNGLMLLDGEDLVLFDREGARVASYPLHQPLEDAFLGSQGGVAIDRSGRLYGLMRPGDPRIRAWTREAHLILAKCALQRRSLRVAKNEAEAALRAWPGDPEALLLIADLSRGDEAISRWQALRASTRDPARIAKAEQSLDALMGVVLRKPGKAPPLQSEIRGDWLLLREKDVSFLVDLESEPPRLKKLPKAESAALAEHFYRLDQRWYRLDRQDADHAEHAEPAAHLSGAEALQNGFWRRQGDSEQWLDAWGEVRWTRPSLQAKPLEDDRNGLLELRPELRLCLSDAQGETRWCETLTQLPTQSALRPSQVVLVFQDAIEIRSRSTGRLLNSLPRGQAGAVGMNGDFIYLHEGATLSLYSLRRGRVVQTTQLAWPEVSLPNRDHPFVIAWDPKQPEKGVELRRPDRRQSPHRWPLRLEKTLARQGFWLLQGPANEVFIMKQP